VTHDQEEAFALADRLLILQGGQIVRQGTPAEVWDRPGSAFVAGFLGLGNIMEGEVRGMLQDGNWRVGTPFGDFDIRCEHEHRLGDKVHLLARPMSYRAGESTAEAHSQGMVNSLNGTVSDILFQQDRYKVTLHHGLYVYLQKAPRMGERIDVQVKVECLA
jgi:ABC-type Fe3+/spermidine/putrescine transport system ATPase subunit